MNRGLKWAFIAVMGALTGLAEPDGREVVRAVWEGFRHGRRAHWLHNEDIAALFAEPLEAARARLGILRPVAYERAAARAPSRAGQRVTADRTA